MLVALIVVTLPTATAGGATSLESWVQLETDHFVILSNAPEERALEVAAELERLRSVLVGLNARTDILSPVPTRVFLMRGRELFDEYRPRGIRDGTGQRLAGYFQSSKLSDFLVILEDSGVAATETLFHEYLHSFARHNMRHAPLWLNEGLAEFYSTFRTDGERAHIGRPKESHLDWLRRNDRLPLSELLAISTDSRLYNEGARRGAFYAQSWALVHYLLTARQDGTDQVKAYLASLAAGADPVRAFGADFEAGLLAMEIEVDRYLEAGDFSFFDIDVGGADKAVSAWGSDVPAAARLVHLGDLLEALGARDRAHSHFRRALDLQPANADAHAGIGRLEQHAGDIEQAIAWFEEAYALDRDRALPVFLLGNALLRSVYEPFERGLATDRDRARLERARSLLGRAAALAPDLAEAQAAAGASWLIGQGSAPEVLRERSFPRLASALALLPERRDIAFNLVVVLSRIERFAAAESVVAEHLEASSPELATRALETVARERLRQAALLIESGRLAAGQELADDAMDRAPSSVRAAMAEHYERILQVLEHNQQIDLYNQAVELARAQRFREAEENLQRVLRESRDEQLLRAARDLQQRLRATP